MVRAGKINPINKYIPTGNKMFAVLIVINILMHINHFNKDLMSFHVWRQTQTQSNITNFYEEDMNILNPRKNDRGNTDGIFRMEFPLMQWLVACSYKVFGHHIIITRIAMFLISLFSLLGIYRLIKLLTNNEIVASLGMWAINFSPTFFYYSINPLPDDFALCLSIWGLVFFLKAHIKKHAISYLLSGLFLCLGTLCKLPFILYYLLPMVVMLNQFRKQGFKKEIFANGCMVALPVILPAMWYITVIPQWKGNGIVQGVTDNQVPFSKVLDYLQHNLFSTLPELLLNYGSVLFFITGLYFIVKHKQYKHPLFWAFAALGSGVIAYFLFEINMIVKVHDYYLFPFFPLLFVIVAYGIKVLWNSSRKSIQYLSIVLILILPLTAFIRLKDRWNPDNPGFNKDLLVYKTELRNAIPGNKLCVAGIDNTHFVMFYYIDKKGWAFDKDSRASLPLAEYISKGAEYLYSDDRDFEKNPAINPHLDSLLMEKGSIRVYKLK